jgi:hypothetical protein
MATTLVGIITVVEGCRIIRMIVVEDVGDLRFSSHVIREVVAVQVLIREVVAVQVVIRAIRRYGLLGRKALGRSGNSTGPCARTLCSGPGAASARQ